MKQPRNNPGGPAMDVTCTHQRQDEYTKGHSFQTCNRIYLKDGDLKVEQLEVSPRGAVINDLLVTMVTFNE